MTPEAWERWARQARRGLEPARALLGRWTGRGRAHGEPVTASLVAREILDGSMVEVWERVGDHEDLSLYRFDPSQGQLVVLHCSPGAVVAEHLVEATIEGLAWVTGPDQPAVVLTLRGPTLHGEVVWPGQRVAEVEIHYRKEA